MKSFKKSWGGLGETAKIFILCFLFYFITKTIKND